jgi:hypothetical protein
MSNTIIPYYKAKAEEMNLDPKIIDKLTNT